MQCSFWKGITTWFIRAYALWLHFYIVRAWIFCFSNFPVLSFNYNSSRITVLMQYPLPPPPIHFKPSWLLVHVNCQFDYKICWSWVAVDGIGTTKNQIYIFLVYINQIRRFSMEKMKYMWPCFLKLPLISIALRSS